MSGRHSVIVIGGGIVGCSCLYGLARLGWTDALLLERLDLTHGSTWHAAGNVTHFGHYTEITRLYVDSLKLYCEAAEASGQDIGLHRTGSLRLAASPGEFEAFGRLAPLYDELQVPFARVGPDEIAALHPFLNVDGISGAAHTPADGHVDPSGATHALAKAARALGAEIKRHTPVTAIETASGGGWRVTTPDGAYEAEHVVVAASFWARELLEPVGLDVPVYALEHHEIITEGVPALAARDVELPTVRDPLSASNVRQEGDGFLIGVYESEPKPWSVDGIPADFGPELLPPDLDRLEDKLALVMERHPLIAETGIKTINNGPICYTPDGCPMLGPVAGFPGLWLATGFSIGIGTGGGSGAFLASWMADGKPPYDLPIVDTGRFDPGWSRDEIVDRIVATYARGYGVPK